MRRLQEELQTKLKEAYTLKKQLLAQQPDNPITPEHSSNTKDIPVKRVYSTLSKEKQVPAADKFGQLGNAGRTRCKEAALSCYQNEPMQLAKKLSLSGISSQKSISSFLRLRKRISVVSYNNEGKEEEPGERQGGGQEGRLSRGATWNKVREGKTADDIRKVFKTDTYNAKKNNDGMAVKNKYKGMYRNKRFLHQKRASVSFVGKSIDSFNDSQTKNYGL